MAHCQNFIFAVTLWAALGAIPSFASAQDSNTQPSPRQTAGMSDSEPQTNDPNIQAIIEAFKQENFGRAIMLAEEQLKKTPDNLQILSILAVSYAQNGDPKKAEPIFEQIREKQPDNVDNIVNLCAVKLTNDSQDAVDVCSRAAEIKTDNASFFYQIGTYLERKAQNEKAREMYLKAYELEPKNTIYLTAVTSLDSAAKNYDSVYTMTEKAIQNGNDNAILYHNLILAANRSKRYDKALKWVDIAMEKFHDDTLRIGKAEAYYALKKYKESADVWKSIESSITEGPNYARFHIGYGKTLLSLDDPKSLEQFAAVKESEMALRDSDYKWMFALAYMMNGKYDEAWPLLESAANTRRQPQRLMARMASVALNVFKSTQDARKNGELLITPQMVNDCKKSHAHQQALMFLNLASQDDAQIAQNPHQLLEMGWSPSAVQAVSSLNGFIEQRRNARCHCELMQPVQSPSPMALILAFLAALFGFGLSRRKNHCA